MTFITADHAFPRRVTLAVSAAASGNALLVLLFLYPLLRFVIGGASLAVLGLAVLILAVITARSLNPRVILVAPLVLLTLTAALVAHFEGDSIVGNYFFFETAYFLLIPLLCVTTISYQAGTVRIVSLLFVAACVAFLVYPGLTDFGSSKYQEAFAHNVVNAYNATDALHDMIGLAEDRFHAYFIHSNEFGVFAAGLLIIQAGIARQTARTRSSIVDTGLSAAILFFILFSQSVTAIYIVAIAMARGMGHQRGVLIGAFGVFLFLFISQLFYAAEMANYLQEGSFWWRYIMAMEVSGTTPWFHFAPLTITELENWPHSILLDTMFTSGQLGPFLLLFGIGGLALFTVPPRIGAGLFAFFTCAALQPAGAMPSSFLILLVALLPTSMLDKSAKSHQPVKRQA